jgi:fibronectin type 3 domain-containing protein
MPGDGLQTMAVLYNVDAKAVAASNIEIRYVLYKDGVEYQRGEATPLDQDSPDGVLILRRLAIGPDMPPGDYILQLVATDKKNSKKQEGVASRTLGFIVTGSR